MIICIGLLFCCFCISKTMGDPAQACYSCHSQSPHCRHVVTDTRTLSTTRCRSMCFLRKEGKELYRGCFDGWLGGLVKHDYLGCHVQNYLGLPIEWCFCKGGKKPCNGISRQEMAALSPSAHRPDGGDLDPTDPDQAHHVYGVHDGGHGTVYRNHSLLVVEYSDNQLPGGPSEEVEVEEDKEKKARFAEICYGRREGTYADVSDCTAYFFCANGITYHMRCPKGTVWSQRMRGCAFASTSSVAACHKMVAQLTKASAGKYDVSADARELMDDDVRAIISQGQGQNQPETSVGSVASLSENKISPTIASAADTQLPKAPGLQGVQENPLETVHVDADASAAYTSASATAINSASSPSVAPSPPVAPSLPSAAAAASKYNNKKMTVYYEINRPRVAATGKNNNNAVKRNQPMTATRAVVGAGLGAAQAAAVRPAHASISGKAVQVQANAQALPHQQKPALLHPPSQHHSSHHHFVSHTSTLISSPPGGPIAANSRPPWPASHSQTSPGKYNSISQSQHLLGPNTSVKKMNPALTRFPRRQLHSSLLHPNENSQQLQHGHRINAAAAAAATAAGVGSKADSLRLATHDLHPTAANPTTHAPHPQAESQADATVSDITADTEVRLDETAHG